MYKDENKKQTNTKEKLVRIYQAMKRIKKITTAKESNILLYIYSNKHYGYGIKEIVDNAASEILGQNIKAHKCLLS